MSSAQLTDLSSSRISLNANLVAAIRSKSMVRDQPHRLYKYPARFAPEFAREIIKTFSKPGDVVLDLFCGSGTALIEAVALGRYAIGYDISQLACFVARVKATPLTIHDERALIKWANELTHPTTGSWRDHWNLNDTETGYYKRNLPENAHKFFASIIEQIDQLANKRQKRFARLILLSVGQWALDCKTTVPTFAIMQSKFVERVLRDVIEFRTYTRSVARTLKIAPGKLQRRRIIVRASSENCETIDKPPFGKASLIVTSPPYPGVHMLYHRWQVLGRRETPAPFAIADCRDGDGISFYTMGHRKEAGLKTYFSKVIRIFSAARKCLKPDGLVVQMVAFKNPEWQLPAYLEAMEKAGFEEIAFTAEPASDPNGRVWREVPGRRWYSVTGDRLNEAGNEVVLFHRPVSR